MKSRLKFTSVLLLFAMVLSVVPALAVPSGASAAVCYQAQFVADVTVPDGTRYNPDTTFTKTWRLRNIGTCSWNSTDVSMIYESGAQLGAPASVPMPSTVAPGSTVDISVPMKAPSAAGHYIGYWKFKSSQGTIFGIGVNANKAWWVEINVVGGTTGVAYDFTANAGSATWTSGAGGLTFPGTDNDAKGFALKLDKPKFESNVEATQPGLLFSPQQITNGFIQASYPGFPVQSGDRFQTTVGCQVGATSCYVAYRLDYEIGSTVRTFWTFRERFEGLTYTANLNLTPLAGQTVKFILYISAYGSAAGDRAIWGNPVIVRSGIIPPPTVPGTPPTAAPTVPPSACDKAQFIADVTIKDGTVMQPGAQFTKTWDIKNVGTCTWKKDTYQLVYFSGEQMGGQSPQVFKEDVPVGKTVRVSVNLTAPSAAGTYRGYWMFKNASGALFGIGLQANKPWWVDIKVTGPTVTPGGPTLTPTVTVTPGGPTVTPVAGSAYDFAANACNATWASGAGQLTCPGTDGDAKGFVLKVTNPKLESGATDARSGILTFPQNVQNGYIQGTFPAFPVKSGDRFRSVISCEGGATSCYVEFGFEYQIGSDPVKTFRIPFREKYEGNFYAVDVDLSWLAGKDVKFILKVNAYGPATGDRALWVGPHIYRATGSAPATSTATTGATATSTATATTTATATETATATSTPTPTATTNP
ncbi:MAG TPA: NBR1-Ig-like domain-containing protein [Anaerolineales bacterium]|nr:NBR1-Ig-like domain-containing protein [Anaerolineales bacterium]